MKSDRYQSDSEFKKFIKGISYILLLFSIIYIILYIVYFNEVNEYITSIFKNNEYSSMEIIDIRDPEKQVYNEMHKMANTLIIAVDNEIWGEQQIKQKDIDRLMKNIKKSNYEDKDILLAILSRWKENDFSQGVSDHNYVWNKLEGTLGKAIEVKSIYK